MTNRDAAARKAGDEFQAMDDGNATNPSPITHHPSPIAGAVGEAGATRAGEDTRRRGWFWHWNSIVTQYAPLLGLKGIGLLNSYTVWTDRREESPHRGYAFPSQQSEADFYGEDRAELITINKILVALDLIEIRKEMVLRTDERGRRWRVPHNFYRVKDHSDGFALTTEAVLRVVELADRDKAVYRYIRRLFSPRFAPIDSENTWHRILPELRRTDAWQRLAARAAREETRASARSRAGHAARRANAGLSTPDTGAGASSNDTSNDSESVAAVPSPETSVASVNEGSAADVDETNTGLTADLPTSVAPANEGGSTSVGPTNTTYDQFALTTTTTQPDQHFDRPNDPNDGSAISDHKRGSITYRHHEVTAREPAIPMTGGPGNRPAPDDARDEAAALQAFEDANARRSTPAERQLLRGLAERFDPPAREASRGVRTGWAWVAAAVYEAVEAGSAFVAPRRLREILTRWERDGFPGEGGDAADGKKRVARKSAATREDQPSGPATTLSVVDLLGDGSDLSLPHGFGSRRTWAFTVGLLGSALDPARLAELVTGTSISGYRDGEVTIAVPSETQAEQLATTHHDLITRKLSEAMRRPVRLAVLVESPHPPAPSPTHERGAEASDGGSPLPREGEGLGVRVEPPIPTFIIAECGLPSGQVWSAVLEEIRESGEVSRANYDTWLRATALIGRDASGTLIVGVPNALAQRRVAGRFAPHLRAAVAATIGAALPIEVVVTRDWLLANPEPVANPAANRPPHADTGA